MITLFTTFFLTKDLSRQNELLLCLQKNIENSFIKTIFVFLDGKANKETKEYILSNLVDTNKLTFIELTDVPTYGDWISNSKKFISDLDKISVFTNADIYVDETISRLEEYTVKAETIVCLSRHDVNQANEHIPHPNPYWSQDLWAISKENISKITNQCFINELTIISTGMCRCDNKLAYIFAMRGWEIYNPYLEVKCYHVQKNVAREYGKFDKNIIGGLCFVSATDSPDKPSELDISVMPIKVGKITKCAINKYLQKNLFPEISSPPAIVDPKEFRPWYTYPNKAIPFREYYTSDKLQIFIIENIVHNYEWLKLYANKITNKHFFFVYLGCYHSELMAKHYAEMFEFLKLNKDNFFFMCNSSKEVTNLSKYEFKCDVINHNAWLDENLYSVQPTEKIFDAILIARQAKFKRHYLANKVPNLALVAGGVRHGHSEVIILPPHVYNNNTPLNLEQITEKINQSQCGLCLSKEEGACFSSSEYLLCGIPVVSTVSDGGRDFWYDDYNSLICDDNEDSVAEAVTYFLDNKRDPEKIRTSHIELAKKQRAVFIKVLQSVFFKYNIDVNAYLYFKDTYFNKMRTSAAPNFDKIFV